MGVFDKFIDAIRINEDDYDEDEFYDDDDLDGEDDYEEEKPKKGRFGRKSSKDDDDSYYEEEEVKVKEKTKSTAASGEAKAAQKPARTYSSKMTPIKRRNGTPMEVCVVKPASMDDTREIADTLLSSCTVVLNLEGIDYELAQRVIDFTSGTCYAINGSLQRVSNYIFILSPSGVDISGDITDILSSTASLR